MDVKTCNTMIGIALFLAFVSGLFVAYCLDNKMNEILFLPLAIGFVFVCIAYFFIEKKGELQAGKKGELQAGKKVDKY